MKIRDADNFFSITFQRAIGELVEESSGKSSGEILDLIRENPYITIPELADKLGLTTRTVEKHIANLKSKGLLKREGPDKGGYWVVK